MVAAGDGSGDGAAAADGEEQGDDERQIEDGQRRKQPGQKHLQQDCAQRHEDRDREAEALLLDLAARHVAACDHWILETGSSPSTG